jgi:tetratricopeptide (TPR) repeat protein
MTMGIDARLSLRGVFASLNDNSGMQEYLQHYLAEADSLAELAGDRLNLARVYISRGAMLSHWGDLSGAIELSRKALDVMLAGGDTVGVVSAAFALAQAQWYSGDLAEARDTLVANLAYAREESGQRRSPATFVLPAAVFFCYLARIQGDLGDSEAGFAAIREARCIADKYGHAFDEVLVDLNEGALLLAGGEVAAAIDMLERALRVARTNKIEWHVPSVASVLGRAYVETGRHADARALLEPACTFADRNRHIAKRLLCGPPLIRALAGAPHIDLAAARELAARTLQDASARGFRPIVVQGQIALAHVLTLSGRPEDARAALQKAFAQARQMGLKREASEARESLAGSPQQDAAIVLAYRGEA